MGAWLPWAGVLGLLTLLLAAVRPAALLAALHHTTLWLLVPVLACSLVALLLRAMRWHLLVRAIAAPNTLIDSLILFVAAQTAQLVPGGLLLPVLQRSRFGTPVRRSTPTVLVQDLLFGLLVLPAALPGVLSYPPATGLLVVAFLFNAGTGLMLWQGRALGWGLRLGQHVPVLCDHVRTLSELQEYFVTVASSPTVLWGALLDMAAIGLAGLGLWLCLQAVGATHTPWIAGVAIYGLGTSAGTLSALPGGVGANEDVSTLVLTHMGVAVGPAAAATLLFRATTVLARMAIGWLVLLVAGPRLKIQTGAGGLATAIQGAEKHARAGDDARKA